MPNKKTKEGKGGQKLVTDVILEAMVDGVTIVDNKGRVVQANKAFSEMYGYKSADEVTGKRVTEFIAKRESPKVIGTIQKNFNKGVGTRNFEFIGRTKDGKEIPIMLNATVLKDASGKTIGNLHVHKDITDRKKAEEESRESEEKFRRLFESSNDAIFIADSKTRRLVDCNRLAEKLTGYSRERILSMEADKLHPKDKVKEAMEGFKKQAAGELSFVESEILTKDGKRITVSINAAIVEIAGKEYLQGIFRDITESKRVEEEIKARVKELEDFHDVAVSRELEMIRLEKEIERLKKELEKKS